MNQTAISNSHESATERRARVLTRMAATRREFDIAADATRINAPVTTSRWTSLSTLSPTRLSLGDTLLTTPNAQTIAAFLVGSIILGPRRVITLATVPLIKRWISRLARA